MSLVYRSDAASKGRRNSIFIGGKVDAKNKEWLRQSGIDYILNVTPPKEAGIKAGVPNFFESSNEFHYKRIAVYDASTTDLLEHADSIVTFLSKGILHGSVLVHCQQGVSRSATSVAFYLMRKVGMTLEEAMAVMTEKRPTVQPIPAFRKQLQEYEAKCIELGVIGKKNGKKNDKGTTKRKLGANVSGQAAAAATTTKAIGPAMPPSGPTMPPTTSDPSSIKRRKAIGPAMPPQAIGPAMGPSVVPLTTRLPPTKRSIGPAMPPT